MFLFVCVFVFVWFACVCVYLCVSIILNEQVNDIAFSGIFEVEESHKERKFFLAVILRCPISSGENGYESPKHKMPPFYQNNIFSAFLIFSHN